MLDKTAKDKIIAKFKTHKNDTGSPNVQIAILTAEISLLTEHLRSHKKDFSSRKGLYKKVGQRRRLLRYLEQDDFGGFTDICKKLKLKVRPLNIQSAGLPSEEDFAAAEAAETHEEK